MSQVKEEIITKTIGFEFLVQVERESVEAVPNTRASAKTTIKESITGHADTYNVMLDQRNAARKELGLVPKGVS